MIGKMTRKRRKTVRYARSAHCIGTKHFSKIFFLTCHVTCVTCATEEWEERLQILADARNLKKVAGFFLHPEHTVESSATATARCYFGRASAPTQESLEDAHEHDAILADLMALKKLAKDYMHPEAALETDPAVMGRNYFGRSSAVPTLDEEDAEERMRILEETKALKKLAVDYMHPELPVVTSDGTACGRNYFTRPSATEQDDAESEAEQKLIMDELKALKQLAVEFMHPELPVVTSDSTACGRNYFGRPSAPEQDDVSLEAERVQILAEMKTSSSSPSTFCIPSFQSLLLMRLRVAVTTLLVRRLPSTMPRTRRSARWSWQSSRLSSSSPSSSCIPSSQSSHLIRLLLAAITSAVRRRPSKTTLCWKTSESVFLPR